MFSMIGQTKINPNIKCLKHLYLHYDYLVSNKIFCLLFCYVIKYLVYYVVVIMLPYEPLSSFALFA